ncbi:hypothetical protein BB776_00455 [Planococcus salinarum]|uniref:Prolow-density lipoprotein receptor-related protein 1-like beta-propeller domain-containing protein n=1 Tax=Planococcus salinarum TaxID=622695 RepID=A0ABX3D2M8_9BACL|nr:hypothetical protein [Planococcus salinarum]OHX52521.1 hypothetical protein BB776_00455 [Planococcus salinarum]TAA72242.1 hypothetical protein D2909_07610 [Planococcus salinarum]
MHEDLKRELEESIPEDVTLSDAKKRQILKAAQEREGERRPTHVPKLLPALAGVAVIGLAGVLGYPYVSDLQEQSALEEIGLVPQELIVTGHEYPDLITSVYDDERDALIYNINGKIYSFDAANKTETVLVNLEDGAQTYEVVVEGDWLAWEVDADDSAAIEIMDLETNERKLIQSRLVFDLNISGNYLIYAGFEGEEKQPSYKMVDLLTMEKTRLHELTHDGGNSGASVWQNSIVIPERLIEEDKTITTFSVYDLDKNSLEAQFTLPYERAENVTLMDNKVYVQLSDEELTATVFGYMDLATGEFVEIKTPAFDAYAVYGNYVALSVADGNDSNDVELFRLKGDELLEVPSFAGIEERLVMPRFTEEGTLIVNGEAEDRAMYLLDVGTME